MAITDYYFVSRWRVEVTCEEVADIFGDAIRKMTLQDARGILTGGDHAATDFFRRVAGDALTARIRPIVANATDRVGVTQKYKAFTSASGGEFGGMLGALGLPELEIGVR